MKVKTTGLTRRALDWAIATIVGHEIVGYSAVSVSIRFYGPGRVAAGVADYSPSDDWNMGGPLIERYRVHLEPLHEGELWEATVCYRQGVNSYAAQSGPTPLTAAMRAIVADRLGDEVEIPVELLA